MPSERFDFPNAVGERLAALLDRPASEPRAYALRRRLMKSLTCSCLITLLTVISEQLPAQYVTGADQNAEKAAPSPAALADYQRKLSEYNLARQKFDDESKAYWDSVAIKRRVRSDKRKTNQTALPEDYVLVQPPTYSGPSKPIDPSVTVPEIQPPQKYIPVVADFLKAAFEQFQFVPQQPGNEMEYRRAYAKIAFDAGLKKDQVVRVYAFESGGNGKYDVQAGLEYDKPGARAVSTALGYNQLLCASTVGLLAEHGDEFILKLKKRAEGLFEPRKKQFEAKSLVLQRMVTFSKSVPNKWSDHVRIAQTLPGLALHALILDIDIGPMLQAQNLLNSVNYAKSKGRTQILSAVELEMMNLTGDGNGFDMIAMTPDTQNNVPTSNFFERPGYEANPIAIENNVVAKLMTAINLKMDEESKLQGALDLASQF